MKKLIGLALAAAALLVVVLLPAASSSAATSTCPATFQVLHNDSIGTMQLPAGAYTVRVTNMTCAASSTMFAEFLNDYDGNLPSPWRANAAKRSFTNGSSSFAFTLTTPAPPAPPTPGSPTTCPGTFSVLHNDRIGNVAFPQGQYQLKTVLGINCTAAATQFAQFLDAPNGVPAPWTLTGSSSLASFQDNMGGFQFTAAKTSSNTNGGGRTATTCSTFNVVRSDHIGSLYIPSGKYEIVLPAGSSMSCSAASRTFLQFLNATAVPKPWIVDANLAQFTDGYGSTVSFGIDPIKGTIR
ncbi:MAG TPA: hypothetical protein VGM91_05030 [Conexibacter sp.]